MDALEFIGLVLFNLILFRKFYLVNPFAFATSELVGLYFPHWVHLGQKGLKDPYYFPYAWCLPVLSCFYPLHLVGALVAKKLSLNFKFILLCLILTLHFLWASIGSLLFFKTIGCTGAIAFTGACALSYFGYALKQNPCIIYTHAWMPWVFLGAYTGSSSIMGLSLGMITLAGYWPLGIWLGVISVSLWLWVGNPITAILVAFIILYLTSLIQTATSFHYFSGSLRNLVTKESKCLTGNMTFLSILRGLLSPNHKETNLGLFHPEQQVWIGLPFGILALWGIAYNPTLSILLGISILLSMGRYTPLFSFTHKLHQRIPARFNYFTSLCLVFLSVGALAHVDTRYVFLLCVLELADLALRGPSLWPMWPFCQKTVEPEKAFNTPMLRYLEKEAEAYRVSGLRWPVSTGHLNSIMTLGYTGSSCLLAMAWWRKIKSLQGEASESWFDTDEDGPPLDAYGVKFAYTYRKLSDPKWTFTPYRNLYLNTQVLPAPSWEVIELSYERYGQPKLNCS